MGRGKSYTFRRRKGTNTAMDYAIPANGSSNTKSVWVGRILSGFAIAFFVIDGVMKLI
jgi:hypothetical protein